MSNPIRHIELLIEHELDSIEELEISKDQIDDEIKTRKARVFDLQEEIINITSGKVVDQGYAYYVGIAQNINKRW